ncbi:class I SAM-dependent methyltransferase [Candidatus Formimonas warabiya]|uniref:Methyltransferase domain-containing protein n=1 Tax=Formimonas warabiya TaxID=1761012 RepID=A0A3G1KRJ2_FORW1|nr:class I SAM-dependent methyltransferase [Candidatus Formimonas warabiya]ATW25071.1 hypothetical protein DCMF_10040 [Candidatus Formimonas warabiya]
MKSIDFNFVADLYDTYVTVDFDVEFFKKLAKRTPEKCLELMCGTGRVSIPLLQEQVDLTCVDYSSEMLNVFKNKAKALGISPGLICQDVCALNLEEKYAFIFIPFNSFSEISDSQRQETALIKIFQHLEHNGTFVCTLYNPDHRIKTADGQLRILGNFPIDPDKNLIVSYYNQFDPKTRKVTGVQFYEIYDQHHKLCDKRFLEICFSLLTKDDFIRMAENAGFRVKDIYGDYCFSPFKETSMFMNFILKKKAEEKR